MSNYKFNTHFLEIEIKEEKEMMDFLNSVIDYYYNEIENNETFFIQIKSKNSYLKWTLYSYISVFLSFTERIEGNLFQKDDVNFHGPLFKELFILQKTNTIIPYWTKHKINKNKLPCPSCLSFEVSGNSYTNLGNNSWECKNSKCKDRSPSDRGKRFNFLSLVKQEFNKKSGTTELAKKFSKDFIDVSTEEFIEYIEKFHVFEHAKLIRKNIKWNKSNKKHINNIKPNIPKFTSTSSKINSTFEMKNIHGNHEIYNGDSRNSELFKEIENVDVAITSPPYYNARAYSTWETLFDYLNDMVLIAKNTFSTFKNKNNSFYYNIADIAGNPNIVVKSKMDERRLELGAWTIYAFHQNGIFMNSNTIWHKEHPQSKKNFTNTSITSHHRPINSYEHIFQFNYQKNNLTDDFVVMVPVFKINNKKINTFGHTAPFPIELPLLFMNNNTKKVLDPFVGSGTTILAANDKGIIGVGIEVHKKYCELINERIKNV